MEVLGQAFSLPLEEISVISAAASIYIQWLVDPSKRPPAILQADHQTVQGFLQTIIQHLSLLFEPKKVDGVGAAKPLLATLASKHVEVCKLALRAFTQASREDFSSSTWKILLRVMLGITDYLMIMPAQPYCYLVDETAEQLLATLMDLWLRSQLFSATLWKKLRSLYPQWMHRMLVVTLWNAVALALTQRVTKILYGQGTKAVVYTVHSNLVTLELSDEYTVYAWHQILHVLGSPQRFSPQVFYRAVLGMEKLVQVFHSIGQTSTETSQDAVDHYFPSGNTILHVFGWWLFEAAAQSPPEYSEGRAQAFGILCRIFSMPQRREHFLANYLHQFYAVLIKGLQGDLLSLVFIVVNCEDIFSLGLPGVRILVGPFVAALRRLIPEPEASLRVSLNTDDLRRACYKLLCTFSSSCELFHSTPLMAEAASMAFKPASVLAAAEAHLNDAKRAISFADLLQQVIASSLSVESSCGQIRFWIVELLAASFVMEKDPGNLRYLINAMCAFAMDDSSSPGMAVFIAELILTQMCASTGNWSVDISFVAVEALRQLVLLLERPSLSGSDILPRSTILISDYIMTLLGRNKLPVYLNLIIALIELVVVLINGLTLDSSWYQYHPACQEAVYKMLMRAIVLGSSGVVSKRDSLDGSLRRVYSPSSSYSMLSRSPSLSNILSLQAKSEETQLALAAETAISKLMSFHGQLSVNPFFPTRLSSLSNEFHLTGTPNESDPLCFISGDPTHLTTLSREKLSQLRFFVINGSILLCVAEQKSPEHGLKDHYGSQIIGLFRSVNGKWSCESNMVYTMELEKYSPLLGGQDDEKGESIQIETRTRKHLLADSEELQQRLQKSNADLAHLPLTLATALLPVSSPKNRPDDRRALNYKCVAKQLTLQNELLESHLDLEDSTLLCAKVTRPPVRLAEGQGARLFLSHLGLTTLSYRDSVVRLPSSVELLGDLEILDRLSERESFSCSVFYIKSGRDSLFEILTNRGVDSDFLHFISSLGWMVDAEKHAGFRGRLAKGCGDGIPYYSDAECEMVFHVPALITDESLLQAGMPSEIDYFNPLHTASLHPPAEDNLPVHAAGLYSILSDDLVSILWVEDLDEMLTLPSKLQTRSIVYICISPLRDCESVGLYRVRIMVTSVANTPPPSPNSPLSGSTYSTSPPNLSNDAVFLFGPLLDGMVLRRESLGPLVRATAISASRFCVYHLQNQSKPYALYAFLDSSNLLL